VMNVSRFMQLEVHQHLSGVSDHEKSNSKIYPR